MTDEWNTLQDWVAEMSINPPAQLLAELQGMAAEIRDRMVARDTAADLHGALIGVGVSRSLLDQAWNDHTALMQRRWQYLFSKAGDIQSDLKWRRRRKSREGINPELDKRVALLAASYRVADRGDWKPAILRAAAALQMRGSDEWNEAEKDQHYRRIKAIVDNPFENVWRVAARAVLSKRQGD